MDGSEQLIGNVYVLAGVAGLCVIAGLLAFARRRRRAAVAALGYGGEPAQPGSAARA